MHDFIGTIFYFFRNAIPLALIGLAAGAVILVMLNLKCRREGKCFPERASCRLSPSVVLLGWACCHHFNEPYGWYANGRPAPSLFGVLGGVE